MAINIGTNTDGDVSYQNPPVNRVLFPNITYEAKPEEIQTAVNVWLNNHPEATTTVEDGSILPVKLDSSNSATDGYILSYNATAGKFEWYNINSDITDLRQDYNQLLNSAYVTESITDAAIASFSDGADDVPVKSLTVDITPVQSGSGDPSPSNVRPISGWTGANVSVEGLNLFDKNAKNSANGYDVDHYINNANGSYAINETDWQVSEYIVVKPNTEYTVSWSETNGHNVYSCFYDSAKNVVGAFKHDGNLSVTFTTPATAKYVRISTKKALEGSVQLEFGSQASTYVPYVDGHVYPIDWTTEAGTVYGGTLDVTSGVLTVTDKTVTIGSLTWQQEASYFFAGTSDGNLASSLTEVVHAICSCYKSISQNAGASSDFAIHGMSNIPKRILIRDSSLNNSVSALVEQRGTETICYRLAEPVTYQLTPTEVATILGVNNIFADTGNINELTYRADLKAYIDAHVGT